MGSNGMAIAQTLDASSFPNLPSLNGEATVVLTVNGEPITIEVKGNEAPITAGNFVELVNAGFYDDLSFHRVVKSPQPFVVQGGDPNSKDPNFPPERLGTAGYTDANGQARNIPLEILPRRADEAVYGRTFRMASVTARPVLTHTRGAVAMARSQDPNSASSQFYITLADQNFLDGNYAVFGYVPEEGMKVVDKIVQGDRIESAVVTAGLENLESPES
ncbi:MAG: peptidylprolyl isomerase [Cyanobacteria bacterium P01_F01_bin.150]